MSLNCSHMAYFGFLWPCGNLCYVGNTTFSQVFVLKGNITLNNTIIGNVIGNEMNRNVRKRTCRHMRPAKIQISLRIRAGWSESSLGAFWLAMDAKFPFADNGLIRAVWFESSLGAHVRRYVFSRCGSYYFENVTYGNRYLKRRNWNMRQSNGLLYMLDFLLSYRSALNV